MNEIWKDIEGYEGSYQVSNRGQIRSLKGISYRGDKLQYRLMKQWKRNKQGYLGIQLCRQGIIKNYFVHRLVGKAFIQNPLNLPQINHKDGIKINNNVNNLEYVTGSENVRHAYRTGLASSLGESNSRSKLKSNEILEIRTLRESGIPVKDIARKYNIERNYIYSICLRFTWKHL